MLEDNLKAKELRYKVGCYVFAIKAARGFRPVYIGKTAKSFENEIFTVDKLNKYNDELFHIAKGAPVMFFIVHPNGRGVTNSKMIGDIEDLLIQVAAAKNPNLKNVVGVEKKAWGSRAYYVLGKD